MLCVETDPDWCELTEDEIKERCFVLDAAFVYLQAAIGDISTVLKEKYPEDVMLISKEDELYNDKNWSSYKD